MGIIIDIIVILIILLSIFISARHGFVRTLIEIAGFIAAIILASALSSPLADITYEKIIEPPIVGAVQSSAEQGSTETAEAIWNELPEFITKNSEIFGITLESITQASNDKIVSDETVSAVEDTLALTVKPIVVKILSMLYSTVIFIILLILVKILARLLNKMFSFSILGSINSALGGILGVFKGILIAAVFCVAISLAATMFGNSGTFNLDAVSKSYACNIVNSFVNIF